jgi:hypothetical protein
MRLWQRCQSAMQNPHLRPVRAANPYICVRKGLGIQVEQRWVTLYALGKGIFPCATSIRTLRVHAGWTELTAQRHGIGSNQLEAWSPWQPRRRTSRWGAMHQGGLILDWRSLKQVALDEGSALCACMGSVYCCTPQPHLHMQCLECMLAGASGKPWQSF